MLTSTLQLENLSSVTSLLTATYYRGNHDRKTSSGITHTLRDRDIYAGAAGMLIHINGKFTIRKLKSGTRLFKRLECEIIENIF